MGFPVWVTELVWGIAVLIKPEWWYIRDSFFSVTFFAFLSSECNSNRDSVLSYTSVRSNSSYLGSDEMGSGECTV